MGTEPTMLHHSGFAGWQADPEYVVPCGIHIMLSFFRSYDFKNHEIKEEPRVKHQHEDARKAGVVP
jgi:hypothetical protein